MSYPHFFIELICKCNFFYYLDIIRIIEKLIEKFYRIGLVILAKITNFALVKIKQVITIK